MPGNDLCRAAERQGVLALFGPSKPPVFAAAMVREAVRTTRLLDLALRLQAHLETLGVRSLTLKGAALHGTAYPEVESRPMVDADLLVLDDIASAEAAARSLGLAFVERADHAVAYCEPRSGAMVELHWSVTSAPGFFPVDKESLWRGRRRLATGLLAPSAADTLVLLALHAAFQHGLVLRLVQHGDFHALLASEGPDPRRIVARAAEWRAGLAVVAALQIAGHLLGTPDRAAAVLAELRDFRLRGPLARHVASAAETPERFLEPAEPRLAMVRLSLARGHRLDLVRRTLWPLSPDDGSARGFTRAALGVRRGARLVGRHFAGWAGSAS